MPAARALPVQSGLTTTASLIVSPGAIALTQILCGPSSRASDRVIETTAPFEAT